MSRPVVSPGAEPRRDGAERVHGEVAAESDGAEQQAAVHDGGGAGDVAQEQEGALVDGGGAGVGLGARQGEHARAGLPAFGLRPGSPSSSHLWNLRSPSSSPRPSLPKIRLTSPSEKAILRAIGRRHRASARGHVTMRPSASISFFRIPAPPYAPAFVCPRMGKESGFGNPRGHRILTARSCPCSEAVSSDAASP